MNKNYLEKLEFDKILNILSSFCVTNLGKNMALELLPSNNVDVVKKSLLETSQALNLIYRISEPNFIEIADISLELKALKSNSSLSIKSLLNLTNIFKLSNELKNYFDKDFIDISSYQILSDIFSMLYSNQSIIERINYCIVDEFTIDDRASKNLQLIRKQKRKIEQDIRSKLNQMIHSSSYSKYVQENIVTIRNDRFVIPIKEEYRSKIKGFVHDVSNVGSTLFIEPISVFNLNNELNELKATEEIEIEKILHELSSLFYP